MFGLTLTCFFGQVQVKKTVKSKPGDVSTNENGISSPQTTKGLRAPTIRRSKLLIVDLAGSERVDKSGTQYFLDICIRFTN